MFRNLRIEIILGKSIVQDFEEKRDQMMTYIRVSTEKDHVENLIY
mgnify:CR=1 FL=1